LTDDFWRTAAELFEQRVPADWLPLRLLGVAATGLVRPGAVQETLFDQEWRQKQRAVDSVADEIRKRFGDEAIGRAAGRLTSKRDSS
jgi:DNA polymerase-4